MQWELLNEQAQERSYLLVFETGDDVMKKLIAFVEEAGMTGGHLTAIGGFSDVTLAYFDWDQKKYIPIPVHEQVEVLSFAGDIAMKDDHPKIHVHVIVGLKDGSTRGGHLMKAKVRPTLELVLTESPRYLQRVHDAESGLALIRPETIPTHKVGKRRSA